ncbi:TPM domain-containing protein [Chitinibacter sp. SCUT-21]|uniref:TPM domain-containing protein n=1 Tax=Chitinibacter sp. SCUT-21 TaxID=2970891 RepID=UPI0035A594E2
MTTKLSRCWQHLKRSPFRQQLNDEMGSRLALVISQAERGHRGEIRLVIEASLPLALAWQGLSARERAVQWFSDLRVWDTECNTGMVLYLLLAERKIELVADRGIAACVPQAQWDQICQQLQNKLAASQVEAGLTEAVQALGQLLQHHFPLTSTLCNPDELSNEPVIIA